MNTITAMLLIIINNSYQKDANYYIAFKLLQLHNQIATLSVSALAKMSNTSVASVNKFCKMFNYPSFAVFIYNYQNTIQVRKEQLLFRISRMSEQEVLSSIAHYSQIDFNQSEFQKSVDNFVDLIYSASDIELIGAYFPTSLTVNFQEDMIVMGKFVHTYPQKLRVETDCVSDNSLLVLLTLTGRIYDYGKHDFDTICGNHQNIAIISGNNTYPNYPSVKSAIRIPIVEDTEIGNILILEIFRYIKYVYFHKYGKEFI